MWGIILYVVYVEKWQQCGEIKDILIFCDSIPTSYFHDLFF